MFCHASVQINARGIIIFVSGGIGFAPGGERFPAERDDDLFAPGEVVGLEPFLAFADAIRIKTKLPGSVEIEPIEAFDGAALKIRARIFWARIRGGVQHDWFSP